MDFADFSVERHGKACLAELDAVCRTRSLAATRVAVENACHFLLIARMDLSAGAHEPDVVVRVASRVRTMKFAAA
jgi:hypothetical protein